MIDEGNELTLKSAVFPRGSLLVWVDNFFDPLLSPEDYRLGDYWNRPVFRVPDDANGSGDICERISFVKFVGALPGDKPRPTKHGDFNDPDMLRELLGLTLGGTAAIDDCDGCASYDVCTGSYR